MKQLRTTYSDNYRRSIPAFQETDRTDKDIAIVVITCKKNLGRLDFLRKHVYSRLNAPCFFVIGDETLATDYAIESDTITVRTPDDYFSLAQKVPKAMECLHFLYDFSGILKLDDDVWINDLERFNDFLAWLRKDCDQDYLGTLDRLNRINRCYLWGTGVSDIIASNPYSNLPGKTFCRGGAGYFLSEQSVQLITEHLIKYPNVSHGELSYEDVFIGKVLDYYGIKPFQASFIEHGVIDEVDIDYLIGLCESSSDREDVVSQEMLYEAIVLQ
jgi:hypothetical protein